MTKSCTAPPSTAPTMIHSVPGQIAELRGQRRTDQRTGTGDGGEVVTEEDPLIGGLEIVAVAQALGGRGALVVQRHHARGDELSIKPVADGVGARRGDHQPGAADRFSAVQRDHPESERRHHRNSGPKKMLEYLFHS